MAVIFTPGDRVRVINQILDYWDMHGTVRTVDNDGRVWVRLDGFGHFQFLSFDPGDLAGGVRESDLLYDGEATDNHYMNSTGPIGP